MIENLSSINYELNYKKDNNDVETIQDNLLGEVETGIQILCDSDIDSLTKDSPLHILRALYACSHLLFVMKTMKALSQKKMLVRY